MAKGELLRHRDFRLLWGGETVSELGSQVSLLALPLLAVGPLHATTFEMGLLTAASTAAFLVVGLPAGVWVDRMRRRRVMIGADVGRVVALGSIPIAYGLDEPHPCPALRRHSGDRHSDGLLRRGVPVVSPRPGRAEITWWRATPSSPGARRSQLSPGRAWLVAWSKPSAVPRRSQSTR